MRRDDLVDGEWYLVKGLDLKESLNAGQAEDEGIFFDDNYIHIEDLKEKGCEWAKINPNEFFNNTKGTI